MKINVMVFWVMIPRHVVAGNRRFG